MSDNSEDVLRTSKYMTWLGIIPCLVMAAIWSYLAYVMIKNAPLLKQIYGQSMNKGALAFLVVIAVIFLLCAFGIWKYKSRGLAILAGFITIIPILRQLYVSSESFFASSAYAAVMISSAVLIVISIIGAIVYQAQRREILKAAIESPTET